VTLPFEYSADRGVAARANDDHIGIDFVRDIGDARRSIPETAAAR
jgi:hypothetical protein